MGTSGGFSSNAMSPNDITETLRILRPEGFMIWSMKTAQAEHSTEFGLFEQNLTGLVKSGKCTLVKHEMFTDKRNKTGGELYVVKRLAGHFPDYLDRPTPGEHPRPRRRHRPARGRDRETRLLQRGRPRLLPGNAGQGESSGNLQELHSRPCRGPRLHSRQ